MHLILDDSSGHTLEPRRVEAKLVSSDRHTAFQEKFFFRSDGSKVSVLRPKWIARITETRVLVNPVAVHLRSPDRHEKGIDRQFLRLPSKRRNKRAVTARRSQQIASYQRDASLSILVTGWRHLEKRKRECGPIHSIQS